MRGYRYLYEQMVRRELRQKYKGSLLGVAYYLINPLVLTAAYALMFTYVLPYRGVDDYPLFLLIGIAVWLFFSQSLMAAAGSLIDQSALVRKVRFPREIVPAAVVSVQFVIFAVLIGLLIPVCLAIRGTFGPELLLLPVVLGLLGAFVLGLALAVAIMHAYFRDVAPILAAVLVPWFFVTPIFFTPKDFPGLAERPWLGDALRWGNPVAPFIEAVRDVLYVGAVPSAGARSPTSSSRPRCALLVGRALFRRLEARAGGGVVSAAPGEVVLERASRAFLVRADPARTLKELFIGRGRERGGPPPIHALRDVTLRVARGEALGIMGRNGAGKTSTLRVLTGIVPLDSGSAECGGRIVSLLEVGRGFRPRLHRAREHPPQRCPARAAQGARSMRGSSRSSPSPSSGTSSTCRCAPIRAACSCGWASRSPRIWTPT